MMIQKIVKASTLLMILTKMASCSPEEDDLFDQSAEQRMQATLAAHKEVLITPKNGWLMEYYPLEAQDVGCYFLLMRFNDNGLVTMNSELYAASDDPGKDVYTTYTLKESAGPVLSFDTYNDHLHYFCEPMAKAADGTLSMGIKGDFEFTVMSASPDSVILKGKKKHAIERMTPLPENEKWSAFVDSIQALDKKLTSKYFYLHLGGKLVPVDNANRSLFFASENTKVILQKCSYAIKDYGYQLRAPFTLEGQYITAFIYDEKTKCFYGKENPDVFLEPTSVSPFGLMGGS